ncbi:MAG: phosphoglycerate kinase [Desulfotignum sp.]|jgi:phosphoglycerate kinase|nr:phosphoglycerate kinase [Desulfotignum sp.]
MKSVKDISVESKRVFVRVDYNLPMDDQGNITDDNRIQQTLDLIHYLMARHAKIILASHMGRPKGGVDERLSLAPAAAHLSGILGQHVGFVKDCIGPEVEQQISTMKNGDILMLENLRFYPEEKSNDTGFAKKLASLCDIYVNNAFAVSHRDQASVTGIVAHAPESAAGFLLEKEVRTYYDCVENPKRPLMAVIGGAKVSGKLAALENMLQFVDQMVIGGAMANTFLKSQGVDTKGSLVEADLTQTAARIMEKAKEKGIDLMLPLDLVAAQAFDKNASKKTVSLDAIPDKWMAMDIGPKTVDRFCAAVSRAKTIVWNGPMGVFEMPAFMEGTCAVARAIAGADAVSIVGGGDTGLAARECGIVDDITHLSTGGGAFLHLMEGKKLPGVAALEKAG